MELNRAGEQPFNHPTHYYHHQHGDDDEEEELEEEKEEELEGRSWRSWRMRWLLMCKPTGKTLVNIVVLYLFAILTVLVYIFLSNTPPFHTYSHL